MKTNMLNQPHLDTQIAKRKIVLWLRNLLQSPDAPVDREDIINLPWKLFRGLSEEQIQAVCSQINELKDLPVMVGRNLDDTANPAVSMRLAFGQPVPAEIERPNSSQIQAVLVHPSLKIPLSEYQGGYVIGESCLMCDWQGFVAKVTAALVNPNIDLYQRHQRTESELTLSVVFYVDSAGKVRVPRKEHVIYGERFYNAMVLGKLTEEQLNALKREVKINPETLLWLANTITM